ncbi:MAG: hypothetical protein KGL39_03365 [Patescibacteria group bacterium]|nr:hypothetical protein [Patescibacteria group bacterium]
MLLKRRPPVIIGLVGPSGSGKTTVCDHLRRRYGFVRIHAATPLKQAFCTMFNVPIAATEQPAVEEPVAYLGGKTPRQVLERLGVALHETAPLALPKTLDRRLKNMERLDGRGGPARIVIDGIRRQTEAMIVRGHGGKILRLDGGALDPAKPCDATQALVDYDHTLCRFDTPERMLKELDWILRTYFLPDEPETEDVGRK